MKTIIVASKNPVKIRATRNAFARMFPGETFEVLERSAPSGVPDQPRSNAETLLGATNRAIAVREQNPEADFWVGIEGGIEEEESEMTAFAWVVVHSREASGKGRTATFFLPPRVAELVRQGKELGDADDEVFGRTNSKQEGGAIGLLTGGALDRTELYEQGVVMALVGVRNEGLYGAR